MKIFKKIYYPIMTIVAIIAIVFGFLGAYGIGSNNRVGEQFVDRALTHAEAIVEISAVRNADGTMNFGRNSMNTTATLNTRAYIESQIISSATTNARTTFNVVEDDEYFVATGILNASENGRATATVATFSVMANSETLSSATERDERIVYLRNHNVQENLLQNTIVFIPGSQTVAGADRPDVALITVNIDSIGPEATGSALIGAMIEHIRELLSASNPSHSNDLLFVFADGGLEQDMGLRTILNQMRLLRPGSGHNIVDNINFIAQFTTHGNRGPVMVTHAGVSPNETLAMLGNSDAANSSIIELFEMSPYAEEHHFAGNIPSLTFSNVGDSRHMRTVEDNMENISRDIVTRHAGIMGQVIEAFGNGDLSALMEGGSTSAVYHNFFGFNVRTASFMQYILAAIILLLVLLILVLNIKFKSFSMLKVSLGAVTQLIAVTVGGLVVFAFYSIMALYLAAFGVISINAFITFSLFNPGILLSAIAIFIIASIAVYIPLKKAFFIKSPSVVRGGVFITALLAVLTAFIMPQLAYVFTILSLIQLVIMLITMLLKNKFKEKFGTEIESLFPYVWASIITLPLAIFAIVLIGNLTPLIMLPVLVLFMAPLLAVILPFAEMLKPIFTKMFSRIPQIIRTEEVVTEMVEDPAKKGKFTEKTYKKVTKEKGKLRYHHAYGITIMAMFAFVALTLFSAFGGGFNSKINSSTPDIENYFRVGAFNYIRDGAERRLEVGELSNIREISDYVPGLSFNSARNTYAMTPPADFTIDATVTPRFLTGEGVVPSRAFIYRTFSHESRVTVTLSNTRLIDRIYITTADTQVAIDEEANAFILHNTDNSDTITIVMPYDIARYIQMRFEGGVASVRVSVLEENNRTAGLPIHNLQDVVRLRGNESTIRDYIRINTIFTTATSVA
ncbi:MAG: hypothetical protein FWE13_00285 [Firmicutes bacterium]|nr:hypothetical protein [Bacillota bacterium]